MRCRYKLCKLVRPLKTASGNAVKSLSFKYKYCKPVRPSKMSVSSAVR